MKGSKFKTIWHYAIAFFSDEHDLEDAERDLNLKPFYSGTIKKLTYHKASKIAQIHPRCLTYYGDAMMPLFQGQGKLSRGTENPVMAIESLKTKKQKERDLPYILIWKIF